MARKHHNPGCPCCFPCESTDCGDYTTRNIRRVTLELEMPDSIVLIGQASSSPPGRRLVRYTGMSSINGTYTFTLNETTCKWSTDILPDVSGVNLENWLLRQTADCDNIESEIAFQESIGATPYHDGPMLSNCFRIIMQTFASDTVFSHEFSLFFDGQVDCGGVIGISIWPPSGDANLCDESPIVFKEVDFMQITPGGFFGVPQFDCGGLSSITGTATSHEI